MVLSLMAVGGGSCNFTLKIFQRILLNQISFRYASLINVVNIVVCLIGASAFAKASAVILAVVIICLSSVIVSFLAQPAFEV